ncbi:MAG: helix-turn-helix domain-containing protein [Mycobacteriales bacterium]
MSVPSRRRADGSGAGGGRLAPRLQLGRPTVRVVGHEQRHAEQAPTPHVEDAAPFGGVQSVARTLDVFEGVAAAGEQSSINEIASSGGLPVPTTLRLVRTVVDRGYVRQLPNRRHAPGLAARSPW